MLATETIAEDALNCPLCGYDLRALPANRCPECGYAFDPDELRRAKVERREWFFEHVHRQLIRAFVWTTFASLRPGSFWRRLAAAHAINADRLSQWALLWTSVSFFAVMGVIGTLATAAYVEVHGSPFGAAPPTNPLANVRSAPSHAPTWLDLFGRAAADDRLLASIVFLGAAFLWAPATVLAINVFGITLSRAGIHAGHLWRCALYAWPTLLLCGIAGLVGAATVDTEPNWLRVHGGTFGFLLYRLHVGSGSGVALIAILVLSTAHLVHAHTRYLRLPHAVAQALLVQTLVWLGLLTLGFLPMLFS